MKVTDTSLAGVKLVEPRAFPDPRGWFLETHNLRSFTAAGIDTVFVQDNVSRSARGVLRGLHFQNPSAQDKLVSVLDGAIFDVAVDVRVGSPTFGKWVGYRLDSDNHHQLYVPKGFAHGFLVTSEIAIVTYKCSDFYSPSTEGGVMWNDPDIGIEWPLEGMTPELSKKDAVYGRLRDVPREKLFTFG